MINSKLRHERSKIRYEVLPLLIIIVHWQRLVSCAHHRVSAMDQESKLVALVNVYVTQGTMQVMPQPVRLYLLDMSLQL